MIKNFLTPLAIVKLGEYVEIIDNKIVEYSKEPISNTILATDLEGNDFVLNLKSNKENIDQEFVKWFFTEKSNMSIKSDFVLKIKEFLSDSDEIIDQIDSYSDDNNLSKKESREYEKKFLEEKSLDLAFKNKLIGPGSIVRLPISSSKQIKILECDREIPMYDSLCLIVSINDKKEEKPSPSGIYYISQSRHELPVVLKTNKKNKNKVSTVFNNKIGTITHFKTLVRHSIRTIDKADGFYLYMINKNENENDLQEAVDYLNNPNRTKETYLENLNKIHAIILEKEYLLSNIDIYFPLSFEKSIITEDTESLITKIPKSITNIALSNQYSNPEQKQELLGNIERGLKETIFNDSIKVYGIYSILSLTDEIESDTYGFILNNIKKHSLCFSLNDTIDFINKFKVQRLVDLEEDKPEKEELKIKVNSSGVLDF